MSLLFAQTKIRFLLGKAYMSLVVRKPVSWVSDTNRAVQPQKMARGLQFRIYEEEELYYLCSEQLICVFVFAYAKSQFSQNEAHIIHLKILLCDKLIAKSHQRSDGCRCCVELCDFVFLYDSPESPGIRECWNTFKLQGNCQTMLERF